MAKRPEATEDMADDITIATWRQAADAAERVARGAELGERCAKLLKGIVDKLPPTDIRSNAIEAADDLLAWVKEVRG